MCKVCKTIKAIAGVSQLMSDVRSYECESTKKRAGDQNSLREFGGNFSKIFINPEFTREIKQKFPRIFTFREFTCEIRENFEGFSPIED